MFGFFFFFPLQFIYIWVYGSAVPTSIHILTLYGSMDWGGGGGGGEGGGGRGGTGCLEVLHRRIRHIPKLFLDVFDCHD